MVTIPTIDQISGTTVMNKMRSLITNYIDFGTQVAGELSYMMNVIENLPQDITDVYNKATIDAMFANVYQKSETYSKTEVNDLISTIGSFHAVIVDSLPQYGDEGVIYLLKISESGENRYKEYIWINRWELIGELSNVDLANYYTKSESNAKFTQGVGNIGSDVRPIKIINGIATPVSNILIDQITNQTITADKKFTQAIKSGDYAQVTHYEDTTTNRIMVSAYNGDVEGRIELRVSTDGIVLLYLRKVVNGVYTDYLIHQF